MNLVARAEIVARLAHQGQVDKSNIDYTEHLKAVVGLLPSNAPDLAKAAAWLHDVVEDTPLGLHDLEQLGFPHVVVDTVGFLTHTHEHSHGDYIRALRDAPGAAGAYARMVKRADLAHNSSPERGMGMPVEKLQRRYEKATAILDGVEL